MPRFKPSGKPVKPVVPSKTNKQISRLCPTEWGSGCPDHGGNACRCTLTKRHGGGRHECECGGECTCDRK